MAPRLQRGPPHGYSRHFLQVRQVPSFISTSSLTAVETLFSGSTSTSTSTATSPTSTTSTSTSTLASSETSEAIVTTITTSTTSTSIPSEDLLTSTTPTVTPSILPPSTSSTPDSSLSEPFTSQPAPSETTAARDDASSPSVTSEDFAQTGLITTIGSSEPSRAPSPEITANSEELPGIVLTMTNGITDADGPSVLTTFGYTPTSSPEPVQSPNRGFLDSKSAIGTTIALVFLLLVGICVASGIMYRRRRRARKSQVDDGEFFERPLRAPSPPAPGLTIAQSEQDLATMGQYMSTIEYAASVHTHNYYPSLSPVAENNPYTHNMYADNAHHSQPSLGVAVADRPPMARPLTTPQPTLAGRAPYQPSIDSFYGGQGQPPVLYP